MADSFDILDESGLSYFWTKIRAFFQHAPETWQNVTGYSSLKYRRMGGIICFKGSVTASNTHGTSGTVLFTLPAGYRPPSGSRPVYTVPSYTNQAAMTEIAVESTGEVRFTVINFMSYGFPTDTVTVHLDGFSFFTD